MVPTGRRCSGPGCSILGSSCSNRPTLRPLHQQVCAETAALGDQHVGNLVILAARAIFYGIDTAMAQVQQGVVTLRRIRAGRLLTFHDKNANLSRLVEIGGSDSASARAVSRLPFHATMTLSNDAGALQSSGIRMR